MTTFTVPAEGIHPEYAHTTDAGADLRSLETAWIAPGKFRTIRTGVKLAIPEGHFGLVAGRSGLGIRYGIALINGVGVIDAGYRGEIQVGLVNHGTHPFLVRAGDRIAQLILVPFATATFETAELDTTTRGTGGLGSTGLAA